MFSSTRILKVAYLLILGGAVILLSVPSPIRAQRALMAPMAPSAMPTPAMGGFMQSYMQANMMLMQAGRPGGAMGMSMMMGGMGMGGMMGMGGGMMGMMGMGGGMMGMMGGMGMMGMGGGMMGMGGMMMGGMSMMGMGGMGMGGFAGKGMGGFNGKKAL
jgi:hypothetical protein